MNKVLIPVDGSKGTLDVFSVFGPMIRPAEEVILLHVGQLGGKTLMLDMVGDAELATLKESIQETPYKERLDARAQKVLEHFKTKLEAGGTLKVRTIARKGILAEEILRVAAEEKVDAILMGSNGKTALERLVSGSATREVKRGAQVPVFVATNGGSPETAFGWGEAYAAR